MIESTTSVASTFWDELELVYRDLVGDRGVPDAGETVPGSGMLARSHGNPASNLRAIFGLTAFESRLLLLCAGTALDQRFPSACGAVQPGSEFATFGIGLETFSDPHWSALGSFRPLRHWKLLEVGAGPLLQAPLSIDPRILQYLLEVPGLDERLEGIVHPMGPIEGSVPHPTEGSWNALAALGARTWQRGERSRILLVGGRTSDRIGLFRAICGATGSKPWTVDARDLPESVVERERCARLVGREAALATASILVKTSGLESLRTLEGWLERLDAPVAIEVETGSVAERLRGARLDVPSLTVPQRRDLWVDALGAGAERLERQLDSLANAFALDAAEIEDVSAQLEDETLEGAALAARAWSVCRETARRSLDGLAQRIGGKASWTDLVLPPPQTAILRQIADHARHASRVHDQWGFASRETRGLGLSALFSGASGTGKTMAAGVIARELDRDLYQIDLATVVSKYIGETEKHLRTIFDAAERSGAILLFDEADALFGKRSQVKDSHDRYANLEVSYLLQRMEAYRGIAILTTNLQGAIDPAFLRRLRFVVQVPFPDAESRERIWRSSFPAAAPTSRLDLRLLSQLNVTGGVIRNIALLSAFLAASEGTSIEMRHVLEATRTEYAKLDKSLTASETRGWA